MPIGPQRPSVVSKHVIRVPTQRKKTSLFEGVSPGNVGNVFTVSPDGEAGPGSVISKGFNNGLDSYGTPVRVLEVVGEDELGEMLCVSLQQESEIDQGFTQGASPTFYPEGPMVGMVEFGAGAGLSYLEFDIPSPTIAPGNVQFPNPGGGPPTNLNVSLPVYKRDNGVLLTLPASSMRVLVRNDALAPYLLNPISAVSGLNGNNPGPGKIRVHATYGWRTNQAKLTRTFPICCSSGAGASPTANFIVGQRVRFGIPPFATRVWFPRNTAGAANTAALEVTFVDFGLGNGAQVSARGPFTVPGGSDGPLEVFPYDTVIDILATVANTADMNVVFELAI